MILQTVEDGDAVEMTAKVTGTDPIQIKWMKGGKVFNGTNNAKVTYANNTATLSITGTGKDDAGNYSVEAKNQHGKASCTASLTVKGTYIICNIGLFYLAFFSFFLYFDMLSLINILVNLLH